jgi:hypothetical protein
MTLTNSHTATLVATVKAQGTLENATVAFAKRVAAMADAKWTSAMLDTKTDTIELARGIIADALLNAKQFAIWKDTSLATKIKQGDKRVTTPRGKLVDMIDKRVRDIRAALVKLEKGTVKKGANANAPRALDQRIKDEVAKLVNAIGKDADADAPVFDATQRKELTLAFKAVTDLLVNH